MTEDILPRLLAHIEVAKEQAVVWGESDCTAWARVWVEGVHNRKMHLPAYASRTEAQRHVALAGSLEALWTKALNEYGLIERLGKPEPGDVGILVTHLAGQVGGIFMNHGLFAWRSDPGCRVMLPRANTITKVWALQ